MGRHSFRRFLGESPENMQKLCLSTKFSHQEISEVVVFYVVIKKYLNCGRLGHFAKYCKTKRENANHQYQVEKLQLEEPVNNPTGASSDKQVYPYLYVLKKITIHASCIK